MYDIFDTQHFSAPRGWARIKPFGENALPHVFQKDNGLTVMIDLDRYDDGAHWIHLSFSYHDRVPPYEDVLEVKTAFIGDNRKAIMVFPSKDEHVNYHPYCLHLYCNYERDSLPDFTRGLGIV